MHSFAYPWQRALSTGSTATSFAALLAVQTKPETIHSGTTGRYVKDFKSQGVRNQNTLHIKPFGGNDNNDTFNIRVTGYNFAKNSDPQDPNGLWIPDHIATLNCTLSSTLPGVANELVVATEFFADTLTLTSGIAILKQGTADVDTASFLVDISGYELVSITFDIDSGADVMNALVRFDT